jgi:hypothetical protein
MAVTLVLPANIIPGSPEAIASRGFQGSSEEIFSQ